MLCTGKNHTNNSAMKNAAIIFYAFGKLSLLQKNLVAL